MIWILPVLRTFFYIFFGKSLEGIWPVFVVCELLVLSQLVFSGEDYGKKTLRG